MPLIESRPTSVETAAFELIVGVGEDSSFVVSGSAELPGTLALMMLQSLAVWRDNDEIL
jgi:hypothetical protein